MEIKQVSLLGAAVHTRGIEPGQDYDWYAKVGEMQLFDNIKEIYRLVLRDVSGEVPRLAVIMLGQHIGFLMGDMPCQRLDHSKRIIYDTLYLEFNTQYQPNILQAVAVLLLCSKNTYNFHEQHFTDYAEKLFENSHTTQLIFKTVKLPMMDFSSHFVSTPIKSHEKWVLFSNMVNRKRCAYHLIHLACNDNSRFYFISTGRVNLDKCQPIVEKSDECILLTLSQDMPSEINLKRGRFSRFKQMLNK